MAKKKFTYNKAAETEVAKSASAKAYMGNVSRAVERSVQAVAPRRTGHYRRSIVVGVELTSEGWKARVGSNDHFWHLVEFGSVNNPAYAPLRRGMARVVKRTKNT